MKTLIHTDKEQIESIIRQSDVCFVGMADTDGTPYVLPMNFGYKDGVIYLHSAQDGRSIFLYWNVIRKSVLRLVLTMPWFSSIRR